jgi:very-short-patch-repair endonuclease
MHGAPSCHPPPVRSRSALPRELRGRPFTAAEARRLGVQPGRLGDPDLGNPFHGVHLEGQAADVLALCRAYASKMRPDAHFTGVTAALLWGMPVPDHLHDLRLHIAVPLGAPVPRGRGVLGRRTTVAPGRVLELDGLRVLSRSETWCELAAVLTEAELVVLADSFVGPDCPAPDMVLAALSAALEAPGRRHRQVLRAALTRTRTGVRSPRETMLRLLLVDAGLPEPEVNVRLMARDGSFLAEGDLVYRFARVVLEYEGDQHRSDKSVFRRDIRRRERYEDAGWSIIRVTADDMDIPSNRRELVERVRQRLARGAATSSAPPAAR